VLDIIKSGEHYETGDEVKQTIIGKCVKCDYMSSNDICKACGLLDGLNKGRPKLGVGVLGNS
jgi:cytoplasmic tRNA 2-thiolation protein 1